MSFDDPFACGQPQAEPFVLFCRMESLVKKGIIDSKKVAVLGYSDPFPQYPWAIRSDLDAGLKAEIKNAFYNLKSDEILKPFKATGFAMMEDKDYDVVRDLAKILNLDLTKM